MAVIIIIIMYITYVDLLGAWLSERLERCCNKPDVVGSIPVTSDFFLLSCFLIRYLSGS